MEPWPLSNLTLHEFSVIIADDIHTIHGLVGTLVFLSAVTFVVTLYLATISRAKRIRSPSIFLDLEAEADVSSSAHSQSAHADDEDSKDTTGSLSQFVVDLTASDDERESPLPKRHPPRRIASPSPSLADNIFDEPGPAPMDLSGSHVPRSQSPVPAPVPLLRVPSPAPPPAGLAERFPPPGNEVDDLPQDDEEFAIREEGKSFRVNARSLLLTYANCACGIPLSDFTDLLLTRLRPFSFRVKSYAFGRELHLDGTPHFHCFLSLDRKCDFSSARALDLSCDYGGEPHTHHPNFRTVGKGKQQGAYEYCIKFADFVEHNIDLYTDSRNFVKRKQDQDAWRLHRMRTTLVPVIWPITLPSGQVLHKPALTDRKRHWFIHGPPGWGKSFWLEVTFAHQRVYKRPSSTNYPFDDYDGEEIVIYDDPEEPPTVTELISVCNVYHTATSVGKTRYRSRFWPLRQARVVFFCYNHPEQVTYLTDARFTSRFNFLDLSSFQPIDPATFVRSSVCPAVAVPAAEHVE